LNLNLIHFIPRLDSIAEQREDYDKAEQEMFQLIINHFNQAQRDQYPSMTTYEKIYYQIAQVLGADRCNSERVRMVLVQIAQLLYSWNPIIAYHDTSVTNLTPQTVVPPPQSNEELINIYLRHLQDLINEITRPNTVATNYCDGIKFGSFSSTESIMAVLLLAFAEDPLKYNYFYPKMTEGVEGTQFFAAVLSLLPWAAEETWQIVLRAESSVLRGQGVQFIPELLEYAILLVMNPQIMAMINGISIEFFARWRFVVIPSVLAVATSSLEKEIENYVQRRPLAYITNPQPYYYSYGYFYRPFYPYYYRPWYARPYHYTSYYSTSHRPGYVSHGPGYSGSSYHGSRYSSLHHHTIG
jgi:hypothetical protein